jgi:hypothetical protein
VIAVATARVMLLNKPEGFRSEVWSPEMKAEAALLGMRSPPKFFTDHHARQRKHRSQTS